MQRTARLIVLVLMVPCLGSLACGDSGSRQRIEPAQVEKVEGTGLSRVTLTPKAAERLGIRTAEVSQEEAVGSGLESSRMVVPYSSVLYDPHGDTWVYVNPEPLVFVRHSIVVDYIEGDTAYLLDGPPPGTAVVTVGVAELYGTESGLGH